MKMRWQRVLLGVVILSAGAFSVTTYREKAAKKQREEQYHAELASYRSAVKLGTTRSDLEAYFASRHLSFQQICCGPVTRSSGWADLVKIGSENRPWYCNHSNVYVTFEFPQLNTSNPKGSDKLQDIELYPSLEECL